MDELRIWHALHQLEVGYWHDVDFNGGSSVHNLYCDDGLFAVGTKEFKGRDMIRMFYEWRQRRGETARHVITNVQVRAEDEGRATASGIITIYRGRGSAPHHTVTTPALVSDFVSNCVLTPDAAWRYASHVLRPIFVGTEMPLSLAIDPSFLAFARSRESGKLPPTQ
jgi:hypothetical protein